MSEIETILRDQRLNLIKNKEALIIKLREYPQSALSEAKVGFFFIDKGATEIEYEHVLKNTLGHPEYKMLLDGIEFFVEVKNVTLEEKKLIKTKSGLPVYRWEFGKHDRHALCDALRRAKKGVIGLYIVFFEINVEEKIDKSLKYIEEGADTVKIPLKGDILPVWYKTGKTLAHDEDKFKEINAGCIFAGEIVNGSFVLNPSLSAEKTKILSKLLSPINMFEQPLTTRRIEELRKASNEDFAQEAFYCAGLKAANILQKERVSERVSAEDIAILTRSVATYLTYRLTYREEVLIKTRLEEIPDQELATFMKYLAEEKIEKFEEKILKTFIFIAFKILLGSIGSKIMGLITNNLRVNLPSDLSKINEEISENTVISMLGYSWIKEAVGILPDMQKLLIICQKIDEQKQIINQISGIS